MARAEGRSEILLRAEGIALDYDGAPIIQIDHLEVRRGEVLVILGPNGAGKSTLLRVLVGLESPRSGRVLLDGRPVRRDDPELRRAAAAVLQRPYLWRGTVKQNVEYGLRVRRLTGVEREARVRDALAALGIAELRNAPVETLSGGEAQRVALARALAVRPDILCLDEPTADLDVTVRRRLLEDLERILRHSAPAIVLVTHDPGEAFALADRVVVLEEGRIVQAGTPAEIFEAPATEFVASFIGAEFMLPGRIAAVREDVLLVRLDSGHLLEAVGRGAPGALVRVAYRPEDVVIGPRDAPATSARNRVPCIVARAHPQGGLVRVRLQADDLSLEALITREAHDELQLCVGCAVSAQVKATALHVFLE